MTQQLGIVGRGKVGSALERGFKRTGNEVRTAGHDGKTVREIAEWASIVVVAVPFTSLDSVVRETGTALDGKIVIDVTNALAPDKSWAVGFDTSGAEELQNKVPKARVVKAFNAVFAQHMDKGHLGEQRLTTFVAGDDAKAKAIVIDLGRSIGFDVVDAGLLRIARFLEPLACLNIQLGYAMGMGTDIGFKLLHV